MNAVGTPPVRRRAFGTYFDSNFLSRGIVMLRSLLRHDPEAAVFVLCLDMAAERVLNAWFGAQVTTIPLARLHAFDPRLPRLESERRKWAYYATHKPALLDYLVGECGRFDWVSFIDADTVFYGSPAPIFDEIGGASVGLSAHRFLRADDPLKAYGKFNAGFLCFRNDPIARRCLRDWRQDCIDWCHPEVLPDGRYMNQGYLSKWLERYPNVAVIRHPGANLAPWNLKRHRIAIAKGVATIDGQPLIFFHFSGVARKTDGTWHSEYVESVAGLEQVVAAFYAPYVRELDALSSQLSEKHGLDGTGSVRFER